MKENGNLPTSLSVIAGTIMIGEILFAGLIITAFINWFLVHSKWQPKTQLQ